MINISETHIMDKNKTNNFPKNYSIIIKLCCIILTAFIFISNTKDTATAAAGLKLYNFSTNRTTTYTDKQLKVTLNGTAISLDSTPGILVNGVALLPYYEVFQTSGIAAECSYDKARKAITISKNNMTIQMTIGSKTATVNGKKVTISAAPQRVTYVASKKTRILIPSRIVSETLKLGYTWYRDESTVAITKNSLLLSYNGGDRFEYNGAKGKVTVDGECVNLGNMPSIIVNDTAMLRASKVFTDPKINADYKYNQADQTVTISKDGNVIVMTIGNRTAYVNDKKKTLSAAPIIVKNCETNVSLIYVPGSFTATSLGLEYNWNNPSCTSVISTKVVNSDPELGDSGDSSETGTILYEWSVPNSEYQSGNEVHKINADAPDTDDIGTIISVNRDYSNTLKNSETYMIQATVPFSKLLSSSDKNKITITSDNELCSNQTISLLGTTSNIINTFSMIDNGDNSGSKLELDLLTEYYHYDMTLSEDKLTLYLTLYYNALTSVKVGTGDDGDYLILTGIDALHSSVTDGTGFLTLDLPYVQNCQQDIASAITGSKFINQICTVSMQDRIRVILSLNDGYKYYSQESGNKLTVFLQSKEASDPDNINTSECELIIPKPQAVTKSMITDTDHYLSNYFVITLPGDYTSQLNSSMITNRADSVSKVSVTCNSDGNTEIKISTNTLQGYEITSDNDNIYVNIGDPQDIYKNIVILDPGHGGTATGAIQNGVIEKDLNLKILYTIGKDYFNQDTSKLKVYYTRTSDADVGLMDRAAFAEKVGADLFVSLHMNSAPNATSAKGTEVFYSKLNNSPNSAGLTSKLLADKILNNLYPAIGTSNRGVKEEALIVDKYNTVPAVLIELGFLTNSYDLSIITDETKQNFAANAIYQALLQVFDEYPTGR